MYLLTHAPQNQIPWNKGKLIGQKMPLKLGADPSAYSTHSFRCTKATLIYRRTKNLRAVQLLLGHTKFKGTVRY